MEIKKWIDNQEELQVEIELTDNEIKQIKSDLGISTNKILTSEEVNEWFSSYEI